MLNLHEWIEQLNPKLTEMYTRLVYLLNMVFLDSNQNREHPQRAQSNIVWRIWIWLFIFILYYNWNFISVLLDPSGDGQCTQSHGPWSFSSFKHFAIWSRSPRKRYNLKKLYTTHVSTESLSQLVFLLFLIISNTYSMQFITFRRTLNKQKHNICRWRGRFFVNLIVSHLILNWICLR